jgi:hypothetical protein
MVTRVTIDTQTGEAISDKPEGAPVHEEVRVHSRKATYSAWHPTDGTEAPEGVTRRGNVQVSSAEMADTGGEVAFRRNGEPWGGEIRETDTVVIPGIGETSVKAAIASGWIDRSVLGGSAPAQKVEERFLPKEEQEAQGEAGANDPSAPYGRNEDGSGRSPTDAGALEDGLIANAPEMAGDVLNAVADALSSTGELDLDAASLCAIDGAMIGPTLGMSAPVGDSRHSARSVARSQISQKAKSILLPGRPPFILCG